MPGPLSSKEAEIIELLLNRGESTGAGLVEAAPDRIKAGSVYVLLKRLVDKGMVSARPMENDPTPGPPRKRYWVLGAGVSALRAEQAANAARHAVLQGLV